MNFVKQAISSVLCIIFVMSVVTPTTYAAEPRYIDLHTAFCEISIENDVAVCYVAVIGTNSGFHYNVTMRLYQDDNDYREWEYTGTSVIEHTETCYVEFGHEYFVGIHIKVYDSAGNLIEQAVNYSGVVEYPPTQKSSLRGAFLHINNYIKLSFPSCTAGVFCRCIF